MVTRSQLVEAARSFIGARFSHQGRTREFLDCGGLVLMVGRTLQLTQAEELGYASYPMNGRFEQLLREITDEMDFESVYPHKFTGEELKPGDLLSYDYQNGEGVRHVAMVTQWDGKRYWVIDAIPEYGVSEHPLAHPFSVAKLRGYRPRGLAD